MTEHDWIMSRTDEDVDRVRAWTRRVMAALNSAHRNKARQGENVCIRGHVGNFYTNPSEGHRRCRTCRTLAVHRWRKRIRLYRRAA